MNADPRQNGFDYVTLPKTVRAYAAGLVDGEGCITIGTGRRRGAAVDSNSRDWRLRVTVVMTHEPTIRWLSDHFGGTCRPRNSPSRRMDRLQGWTWSLGSNRAARFLRAIRPWLITKAEQADTALAFQARLIYPGGRKTLPPRECEARLALIEQLKDQRGRRYERRK